MGLSIALQSVRGNTISIIRLMCSSHISRSCLAILLGLSPSQSINISALCRMVAVDRVLACVEFSLSDEHAGESKCSSHLSLASDGSNERGIVLGSSGLPDTSLVNLCDVAQREETHPSSTVGKEKVNPFSRDYLLMQRRLQVSCRGHFSFSDQRRNQASRLSVYLRVVFM